MRFCQITNLPALGPVANTNAIPIQNNVNPHQHESNVNAPYGVQGLTAPQSNLGGDHRCKTYELNQQHYLDRGIQNEFNLGYQQHAYQVTTYGVPKTSGVNEISVIFHVVHNPNNPAENVSNALIMQVFDDLVEDFQLLNANAANARTQFGLFLQIATSTFVWLHKILQEIHFPRLELFALLPLKTGMTQTMVRKTK